MSLEMIDAANISHIKWVRIEKNKCNRIMPEKVYIRISTPKDKPRSKLLTVYIGEKISEIMGFKKGALIDIDLDAGNIYLFKMRVSETGSGYTLSGAKGSTAVNFNFQCPVEMALTETPTVPVDFNLITDKSIVLKLTKHKIIN